MLRVADVRFPGQYFDVETGMHYNYFRDYDATTGRYVESDPIGLNGGANLYPYVANNPLTFSDQLGTIKWQADRYSVGFLTLLGGGGVNYFELTSQCVNHKYAYVRVVAVGLGSGLGAKFGGSIGGTTFEDFEIDLRPDIFNGLFVYASAGYSKWAIGGGCAFIQLGGAYSVPTGLPPAPEVGVDRSIGAIVGHSFVIDKNIKDCECNKMFGHP